MSSLACLFPFFSIGTSLVVFLLWFSLVFLMMPKGEKYLDSIQEVLHKHTCNEQIFFVLFIHVHEIEMDSVKDQ